MQAKTVSMAERLTVSFWMIAAVLLVVRVITLIASPAALGPDESQYWFWSRDLAFGYFSKPPMIAWAIATTTAIFGNEEWVIRLAAPVFHTGAAVFLYLTAQRLFNQHTAFWTGLAWLTIPGVTLSSFLITTDAPLLFFWSAAMFVFFRIILATHPKLSDFAALGAAIGLGLLSKYAMIYFPIAMAGAIILTPSVRLKLLQPSLLLTTAIAVAVVTPNILWNAANDFQTVAHTAANANWNANLFKPDNLLAFLGEQFAIAGPVFLTIFILMGVRHFRYKNQDKAAGDVAIMTTLFVFALTPLLIVSMQAFISRAHANWAVSAYPAIIMLSITWLYSQRLQWVTKATVAFHAVLAFGFAAAMSHFSVIDRVGLSAATREIRAWEEQSNAIMAQANGYDAVMIDDRALMGAMLYYERGAQTEIVAIDPNASISNHYEAFKAFDPARHKRVLFVTTRSDAAHVDYRFHNIEALGPVSASLGNQLTRTYHLFDVSGYFGRDAK